MTRPLRWSSARGRTRTRRRAGSLRRRNWRSKRSASRTSRSAGATGCKRDWKSGRVTDFQCEYRDIVENARIVYVYDMYVDGTKISVSLATITFEKSGKGTKLTVTEQGVFLDGYDDAGARERGTNDLMDKLGRSLQA